MKRFILAAGVAALAITAPAAAKPGGGHGGEHAAKAQHGGGGGHSAARTQHGGGGGQKAARSTHAPKRQSMRMAQSHGSSGQKQAKAQPRMIERHAQPQQRVAQAHGNGHAKVARQQPRMKDMRRAPERLVADRDVRSVGQVALRDFRDDSRIRSDTRWINADYNDRGFIGGCPPGLAKKHNGCMPPGQAKNLIGQRLPSAFRSSMLPLSLRDYYRDNDDYYYRYGDGYLYRVNRENNLIAALLPMFGSALGLGTPFPSAYSNYAVPPYYQSFYPDTRDSYYRYANGNVYGIDPRTGLIQDVVPLMAGGYGVGQLLPAGYSAYNVPYQYRGYYPDSSDAYYRYAPGAIYQVDPRTGLVTSVASLLSPTGFAVGQPLPMGYSAYNVPYQYRSQYYDTPDSWYRYNNGYIYQVDPTTQLISAVIRAIV
jgi:hypothetical protein